MLRNTLKNNTFWMSGIYLLIFSTVVSYLYISFMLGAFLTKKTVVITNVPHGNNFIATQIGLDSYSEHNIPRDNKEVVYSSRNLYTDRKYEYSFEYGDNIVITNRTNELCTYQVCESFDSIKLISVDNLYIETFETNQDISYDFDMGVEKMNYKKPQRILVDGSEMYYIINNDGFIQAIVKDFKYVKDKLWFRDEVYIFEKDYFITFSKGKSSNILPEYKLYLYNTIFENFKF